MPAGVFQGKTYPLGATVFTGGVNFSIFSKNCSSMELLLFNSPDEAVPDRTILLDPARNRTFYYWHVYVPNIGPGQIYAWRAHGPLAPERGLRFDGAKVLLDPYARCVVTPRGYSREAGIGPGDNCAQARKSVVVDPGAYDWEGDTPLTRRYSETVIYELHVGGFTSHPGSGVEGQRRGTFAGLIEKIPHLVELGITAVELLPIHEFDTEDAPLGRRNYWGYSTAAFFAPHAPYSSRKDLLGPVDEFRDMVKALHKAGIEVILDVVFNHSSEGNEEGPTQSFRGLENSAYYMLEGDDQSRYSNYSGCGNTLNTNNSIMRRLIADCLRYWVDEMHVDGFRFDLASVLSRDKSGRPLADPPIIWSIDSDPVLAGTKLIAEAWDAAGLYQVGSFSGDRFAEWNGPFRDDIRGFVKGDPGLLPTAACRILGSPDLYRRPGGELGSSINFITCHDGFTLNDLVSFDRKHNEANGEDNRDGTDHNFSWNHGVEGASDKPHILSLRTRQIKNLLCYLLLAHGTPMISMGDEMRHGQKGNNNVYCQNNELAWLDWDDRPESREIFSFMRRLLAFRKAHGIFAWESFWAAHDDGVHPSITWRGSSLDDADWSHESRHIAFHLRHPAEGDEIYIMLNSHWEARCFRLPPLDGGQRWRRMLDTSLPAPQDFLSEDEAVLTPRGRYRVRGRSFVVLIPGPDSQKEQS